MFLASLLWFHSTSGIHCVFRRNPNSPYFNSNSHSISKLREVSDGQMSYERTLNVVEAGSFRLDFEWLLQPCSYLQQFWGTKNTRIFVFIKMHKFGQLHLLTLFFWLVSDIARFFFMNVLLIVYLLYCEVCQSNLSVKVSVSLAGCWLCVFLYIAHFWFKTQNVEPETQSTEAKGSCLI